MSTARKHLYSLTVEKSTTPDRYIGTWTDLESGREFHTDNRITRAELVASVRHLFTYPDSTDAVQVAQLLEQIDDVLLRRPCLAGVIIDYTVDTPTGRYEAIVARFAGIRTFRLSGVTS